MTAREKLDKCTDEEVQGIWEALSHYPPSAEAVYRSIMMGDGSLAKLNWDTPGPYDCPTMSDWQELVYSEMDRRGLDKKI